MSQVEETIVTVSLGEPGESTIEVKSNAMVNLTEGQFKAWLTHIINLAANHAFESAEETRLEEIGTPVINEEEYAELFSEVSIYVPPQGDPVVSIIYGGAADPHVKQSDSAVDLSQRLMLLGGALDDFQVPG